MRLSRLPKRVRRWYATVRCSRPPKVFGVGFNKTGTTSLARALTELGFNVAPQPPFEKMLDDWKERRFSRILDCCRDHEAFQDIPFSLPFTFQALDQGFPGSRFVLTVRPNPEIWYRSLTRFHSKLFGDGRLPTADALRRAKYSWPGWAYEVIQSVFDTPNNDLYNRERLIAVYEAHNGSVQTYFTHRPDDLLVLDVSAPTAYKQLGEFVGRPSQDRDRFPWINRTDRQPGSSNVLNCVEWTPQKTCR